MTSPLRRAVWLALLTACSRGPAGQPPQGSPSARGSPSAPRPSARSLRAERLEGGCPGLEGGSGRALTAEAWAALDAGAHERALSCADAAIARDPRNVSALAARGGALAAADKLDEARTALARALAIDPDDPAALLGSAEIYVRRMGSGREVLETGLELALRGVRSATHRRERELAARLALLAGTAENDLGRSHLALPQLERAVAALPDDPDANYEKGIALFELCRFDEAQRAFERALALAPDDPWALHQLGLLAERRGEERRATALLARARTLAPRDFEPELRLTLPEFRAEVAAAVSGLAEEERRALGSIPVEIQDLPDLGDLRAVQPPLSPSILGLFRGPPEGEACTAGDGPVCRTIVLYRKNLLRFARDRRELSEQVRVTLLHELGHLHGLSDEDLRAQGLE
jgi:tetratricopeptide (TPR) repeat protein